MPTIRPRSNGKWQAIVRRKGHAPVYRVFRTKTEATRWAEQAERMVEARLRHEYVPPSGWTLKHAIDTYLEEIEQTKPPGKNKRKTLERLSRQLGSKPLDQLRPSTITQFVRDRIAEGAGGLTVNADLIYLGTVLKWCREVERLDVSVEILAEGRRAIQRLGLSTRSRERSRRPTEAELEMLYAHWRKMPRLKTPMIDIVQFAIATAMRLGEICRIEWRDLDEINRTVLIRDRKHPNAKLGNHQRVPLLDATGIDAWAIVQKQPRTESPRIFPYDSKTVTTMFCRAVNAAGIEDLRFHDLRHEGLSRLAHYGYDIPQLALISGHREWKMLARYVQLRAEDLHSQAPRRKKARRGARGAPVSS